MQFMASLLRRFGLLVAGALLLWLFQTATAVAGEDEGGAVYVLTNQSTDNTVVVYQRAANGLLVRTQEVSTQGQGSGHGLGSQGALTLSDDGNLLFAVNAGSNELSVLAVSNDGLRFVDKVASGGVRPISVTVHEDIVYVLNAGGTPNATGFSLSNSGKLRQIENSTHTLAGANAAAAQVGFSPDGDLLLVTEKNTNLIDIFQVDEEGRIEQAASLPSNNATPFGFSFGPGGIVIVSEAAGGAPGASTLSSYRINEDTLETISKSVPDTQAAACWVVITRGGRFAFTSNTASGTVSSYGVSRRGELSLIAGVAVDLGAGSGPTDMALAGGSRFLYVLNSGTGTVAGFRVQGGNLTPVNEVAGLPLSVEGIAAQ